MEDEFNVNPDDIADIMNEINERFQEKGIPYEAVGYENTKDYLMVLIDHRI